MGVRDWKKIETHRKNKKKYRDLRSRRRPNFKAKKRTWQKENIGSTLNQNRKVYLRQRKKKEAKKKTSLPVKK